MHPDRYWLAKSGPQLAVMTGMSGKQMLLRSGIKYSCYFCDSSAEDSSQLIFKCVSLHQMNAHCLLCLLITTKHTAFFFKFDFFGLYWNKLIHLFLVAQRICICNDWKYFLFRNIVWNVSLLGKADRPLLPTALGLVPVLGE